MSIPTFLLPSIPSTQTTYPLPAASILLPLFSLSALLLQIPPLLFHLHQRNLGASSLIVWLSLSLLIYVINPLLWPRDNTHDWWDGAGYCDVVVRVQIGVEVGLPGSALVIVRGLAAILNVDQAPREKRWRGKLLEWWLCLGFPLFIMAIYYVVQSNRYTLVTTTGCRFWIERTWASIVLIAMWPLILSIYNAYLASKSHTHTLSLALSLSLPPIPIANQN
jgi:pheromone a factor receptor